MSEIKKRIEEFSKYKGISVRQMESLSLLKRGNLSNISENGTIGVDKASKIIDAFPDLNPEWLLTGKGEMLRQAEEKEGYRPSQASDATVNKLIEEIKHLSSHIGRLETENERLSHELREKQGTHTRINVAKSKLTHNP